MKRFNNRFGLLTAGVLTVGLAFNFGGCTQDNHQIAGPESATIHPISLAKEATGAAIIKEEIVTPDSGGTLKITGQNFNQASFNIAAGNVSVPTLMRLVKLGEISNTYHLEPFGMDLPVGVSITLDYGHSTLPLEVSESDLKVFQLVGDTYVPLASKVMKGKKMQVKTEEAYSSGEYALGAYDAAGQLHLIEGEYGVRKEAWIQPKHGGTINLSGGSSLTIPGKSINQRTLIGIIATRATILGRSNAKAFAFTPHGTVFNKPATLVLSWRELEGAPVELFYFNELTGEWELSAKGVWDSDNRTVTLGLNHFSRYAVAWSN